MKISDCHCLVIQLLNSKPLAPFSIMESLVRFFFARYDEYNGL
jgi:hypothetical protein